MRTYEATAKFTGQGRTHERILYLVQFGEGTPVKIGSTSDIGARLSKMSVDHYREPNMLYLARGGFREEMALHRKFARFRVRGEWYRPDPEILKWADAGAEKQRIEALTQSIAWAKLRKVARDEEHADGVTMCLGSRQSVRVNRKNCARKDFA